MAPEEMNSLRAVVDKLQVAWGRMEEKINGLIQRLDDRCEDCRIKVEEQGKAIVALQLQKAKESGNDVAHSKIRDTVLVLLSSGLSGSIFLIINHYIK